ncbi:hypothetical protein ACQ4PT_050558 [Festuca glaucescens]
MSLSLRLALPTARPVPLLRPRARNAGCPPAPPASALRTDALRGCASLPLKPQPLGAVRPCRRRGSAAVCHASAYLSPPTMQWVSAAAAAVLFLAKGTGIHKPFLVPLFALQAPSSVISWIKSEYGLWTAFLALLVRLFFSVPGELELPLSTMLLVSVAPYQVMNLRGTQGGAIVSLALTAYLAFQHFTRTGGIGKAFDQGSIIATVAIICITVVNVILLVLLFAEGTGIHKSFLVPLFALQAAAGVISWIKSEYGPWTAFLVLLVRLFFPLPGDLELPLSTMLLVSVAPYQVINMRGTQGGAILSLAVALYLAFQHFTRTGGIRKAFDQGSIIATLAITCITVINVILLF